MASSTPLVLVGSGSSSGLLELEGGVIVEVGSSIWFGWLGRNASFRFESGLAGESSFTARKHKRQSGDFWYAYRKVEGKLRNTYIGKSESLTVEHLLEVAAKLDQQPKADTQDSNKSYAQKCITPQDEIAALQRELTYWQDKARQAELIPELEGEIAMLHRKIEFLKSHQPDLEEIRDRALSKTKLGKQAPDYKRYKKGMDLLIAELQHRDR